MNHHKTIAIIFDFDDTLAPDSTSAFLESLGVDAREYWKEQSKCLKEGWDPVPAYLNRMIELSRERPASQRITKQKLQHFGKKLKFHKGVESLFSRVKKQVKGISTDIRVEFYVISSGIGELLRSTSLAGHFSDIFASDFSYNGKGEIESLKNIVSFTDKTRFIFQISKGITGPEARQDPFAVNRKVSEADLHVPVDQMIVVGDGLTDIPCFSLVQKNGGLAIGVYDRESRDRWGKAWGFLEEKRVSHLVAADFRAKSGLDDAISFAIDKMARDIALRSMTYQG